MRDRLALLAVASAFAGLWLQAGFAAEPGARVVREMQPAPLRPLAPLRCGDDRRVLLCDDFDGENGERPTLMHDGFAQWEVVDGTVDLVGHGSDWDFLPGHGLYVDLDGDRPDGHTFDSGHLVSREEFVLRPGTYELSFLLAGSQRGDVNTVSVRLGDAYAGEVTLKSAAPFRRHVAVIPVGSRQRARLVFENAGADGFGLLLDDVRLRRR